MNFCIFKSAVFDTNHSLWKKRLNQFEEKKTWVIFMLFLANFIGIWFDVYSFGFWPTLIDLYGESQRIFVLQGCYPCLFRRSRPLGRRSRFSNSRSSPKCGLEAPGPLTSSREITVFKIKRAIFHFRLFDAPLWAVNELLHFQKWSFWHKSLALKKTA